MFINNEYSYFAVRIIEDSDNRSSDNRGSTVFWTEPNLVPHVYLEDRGIEAGTLASEPVRGLTGQSTCTVSDTL